MQQSQVKRIIKRTIFCVFFSLTVTIAVFYMYLKTQYVVPILMYHHVNNNRDASSVLTVKEKIFSRQMDFLYRHKYNVISLEKLVDLVNSKSNIPRNTVVITFDDGWEDNYSIAFPILKKYNLPATIFVVADLVDIDGGMVSTVNMKEMIDSGLIEIGSHTLTHACLNKLDSMLAIKKEIADSKKALEQKLGREIKFISYPVGGFSPLVKRVTIEAGYKGAVSVNPGKDYPSNDIYGLKRLRISKSSNNMFVFWFETSGLYTWLKEHRGGKKGKGSYIQCQLAR